MLIEYKEERIKENYFFCFGKGTILQLILDSHPQIHCPPEVSFTYLMDAFPKMLKEFNRMSLEFNSHKGLPEEKVSILDNHFISKELRNLILKILKNKNPKKFTLLWSKR